MNKEKKYVCYDPKADIYEIIDAKNVETVEEFIKYFGRETEDFLDENNEIIIYELVLAKTFKKEINYKFV